MPWPIPASKRTRLLLACLWVCFLVRGIYYSAVLPLWEGYDELSHFSYLQRVAIDGVLPKPGTNTTREVLASLSCAPLPWMLKEDLTIPHTNHDQFWRLNEAERAAKINCIANLVPQHTHDFAPDFWRLYESQQPPLYYALLSPIYRLVPQQPLTSRVFLMRVLSVLLASAAIPLTYALSRMVFENPALWIAPACLLAAMPELFVSISRVSNEALSVPMGCLLAIATLHWAARTTMRSSIALSVVVALTLYTKAYFLFAFLAIGVLAIILSIKRRNPAVLVEALVLLSAAAVAAAPWYWRISRLTGAFTGEQLDALSKKTALATRLAAIPHVHWLSAVNRTLVEYIWLGAWSFLQLRQAWIYHLFFVALLAGFVGLAITLAKPRLNPAARPQACGILALLVVSFGISLAYHVWVIYVSTGVSETGGWYLYALCSAECVLLLAGLKAFLPGRWGRLALPLMVLFFLGIDFYGMHFYLLPYYTGLIAHLPYGNVPPLHLGQLQSYPAGQLLNRLLINKSWLLTEPSMITLWILYILATGAVLAIALNGTRFEILTRSSRVCSEILTL